MKFRCPFKLSARSRSDEVSAGADYPGTPGRDARSLAARLQVDRLIALCNAGDTHVVGRGEARISWRPACSPRQRQRQAAQARQHVRRRQASRSARGSRARSAWRSRPSCGRRSPRGGGVPGRPGLVARASQPVCAQNHLLLWPRRVHMRLQEHLTRAYTETPVAGDVDVDRHHHLLQDGRAVRNRGFRSQFDCCFVETRRVGARSGRQQTAGVAQRDASAAGYFGHIATSCPTRTPKHSNSDALAVRLRLAVSRRISPRSTPQPPRPALRTRGTGDLRAGTLFAPARDGTPGSPSPSTSNRPPLHAARRCALQPSERIANAGPSR